MIIQSQDITMSAKRNYERKVSASVQTTTQTIGVGQTQGGLSFATDRLGGQTGGFMGTLGYYLDGSSEKVEEMSETASTANKRDEVSTRVQFETLHYLLRWLFWTQGRRMNGVGTAQEQTNLLQLLSRNNMQLQATTTEIRYEYQEREETSYGTKGTVVTSDGREITFDVAVTMSRRFTEEMGMMATDLNLVMGDPLVINLDADVADVTDQKFYFDLDQDGEEEALSTLQSGSGFLALDRNGDGSINDGGELFGAASGNGFADLAEYDLDGNGWIDEADEVFERLVIWTPNADGTSTCYRLKEQGVGAICLQNVVTDFTLQDDSQTTNGAIRRTGIFLRETGEVGTVQHVDLVM